MADDGRGRRALPRAVAWVGLGVALLAILVATLTPAGDAARLAGGFLCLRCGDAPLANVLRNVVLFLPLGFFAFGLMRRVWPVALAGFVLAGSVELLQVFIPGRNPSLVDVVANTAGAALGGLLAATLPVWFRPAGNGGPGEVARRRLFGAVLAVAAVLAAAPAALLTPAPPDESLWSQWNPPLGRIGPYEGRMLDARIGEASLPVGPIPAALDVRSRFLAGQPVMVTLEVVAPADESRGLFRILSAVDGREVLAASVHGDALVTSLSYRATRLGLSRPRVRAPGLLETASPGDTAVLAWTLREDGGLRIDAGAARWEAPGVDPSMGWSLLYHPLGLGAWGTAALGFLWCAMLLSVTTFLAPGRTAAAASGLGLLLVLAGLPLAVPFLAPLSMAGWAGAMAGWAGGMAVRVMVGGD